VLCNNGRAGVFAVVGLLYLAHFFATGTLWPERFSARALLDGARCA
jgi:hypothetical protein